MAAVIKKFIDAYPQTYATVATTVEEFNAAKFGCWVCVRGDKMTYAYKLDGKLYKVSDREAARFWALKRALKSFYKAHKEFEAAR